MSVVSQNTTLSFCKKSIVKKGDILTKAYLSLLQNASKTTQDIEAIYVTKGPGSFTGARVGLLFAKTLTQVLNTKLFTADTLTFVSGGEEGSYYLDAKSSLSYKGTFKNGQMKLDLVPYQTNSVCDYEDFVQNPNKRLNLFGQVKNVKDEKVIYIKEPRIGGE